MDGQHPRPLAIVSIGNAGGKLHLMQQDRLAFTLCGRSTDGAVVHESEWAFEILNGDMTKATSVCARCRNSHAKQQKPQTAR
jgi:hypothetical protein